MAQRFRTRTERLAAMTGSNDRLRGTGVLSWAEERLNRPLEEIKTQIQQILNHGKIHEVGLLQGPEGGLNPRLNPPYARIIG